MTAVPLNEGIAGIGGCKPPSTIRIKDTAGPGVWIGSAFAHGAAGVARIAGGGQEVRITKGRPEDAPLPDAIGAPVSQGGQSAGWGMGLSIVPRLCDCHAIEMEIEQGASQYAWLYAEEAVPCVRMAARTGG